jgi:hypothetical protein
MLPCQWSERFGQVARNLEDLDFYDPRDLIDENEEPQENAEEDLGERRTVLSTGPFCKQDHSVNQTVLSMTEWSC